MPLTRMTELEFQAERVETPCGDGAMVWRRWGPAASTREPVVLLHGGSGSWTHWIRTIPVLKTERDVWAVDLPGLGDSSMPREPHNPQSCADAVVEGLRQTLPSDRKVWLVCFSYGCHVGTLAATRLSERLTGVVIIGTAALGFGPPNIRPFPKERSGMSAEAKREIHRAVLEILMISKPERVDDEAIELQALNIEKARFRSRSFAAEATVRVRLADVTVPVKTIWGANDVVANGDVEGRIAALGEHHPELEARIIPDAGHWVMYEQADAFNAALRGFID